MNSTLTSIKKRIDDCAKSLPDKRNIDHSELFSKHVIPEMEDNQTIKTEKKIQRLGNMLKLAASFKDMPKKSSKRYFIICSFIEFV
jgi:hypothetical protein